MATAESWTGVQAYKATDVLEQHWNLDIRHTQASAGQITIGGDVNPALCKEQLCVNCNAGASHAQ